MYVLADAHLFLAGVEVCSPVLRIRILMLLGLPDPNPDSLVKDTDLDPSIINQKL
jgi:hypothetical protein